MTQETITPLNVLSLFDGISCGQLALRRASIPVASYHASEIDKHAIKVTQANFPNTVQLGDVTKVRGGDLPKIDLLMGGSPCQGFSFAGKMLNFDDPRSKLFLEYVRLLKEIYPRWFLLENVRMMQACQDVISDQLGVRPVAIDSSLVSAQTRYRLYWTNIPMPAPLTDRQVKLKDILFDLPFDQQPYSPKFKQDIPTPVVRDKFPCLRAYAGGRTRGISISNDTGHWRKLTPVELERLQTVPDDYTKDISNNQRAKALGNGWTVDVIAHIFQGLKQSPA